MTGSQEGATENIARVQNCPGLISHFELYHGHNGNGHGHSQSLDLDVTGITKMPEQLKKWQSDD